MVASQGLISGSREFRIGALNGDIGKTFLWPDRDRHCKQVILGELNKLDKAVSLVETHGVAVQAGGNCGVFPHRLAQIFDWVYTFEPDPENFYYLTRNVVAPNVIKIQGALGSGPGLVKMTGEFDNCGAYQTKPGGSLPTFKIDDLGLQACDFLCLDIEGAEYEAFQGARTILKRFHPVILYEDKGISTERDEIGRWLVKEFGYKLERLPRDVIAW